LSSVLCGNTFTGVKESGMQKCDDDDDNDEYDTQRSRTRNQYNHVRYFQLPNLPYIKTSFQKKRHFLRN